jgi:hypothetical protein
LAVREPPPLLALPAPGMEGGLGEVERRLEANQRGFQKVVMKQIQSLTDQMTLMVRTQQPNLPPPVESGRHALGFLAICLEMWPYFCISEHFYTCYIRFMYFLWTLVYVWKCILKQ